VLPKGLLELWGKDLAGDGDFYLKNACSNRTLALAGRLQLGAHPGWSGFNPYKHIEKNIVLPYILFYCPFCVMAIYMLENGSSHCCSVLPECRDL